MSDTINYDVIVIGAGHAGCEAGSAAAKLGCKTLVFTINSDNIGLMPCNPSIGGPAKGQIVGEVDALGGIMGVAADQTFIQMKILNRSKGPAVQCLRAQNDKRAYNLFMKRTLENTPNLDIRQAMIHELLMEDDRVVGVATDLGKKYYAKAVVVTTGTFLKGKVHIGLQNFSAGRVGEFSAETLSDSLRKLGFRLGRLKTGTTPRLDSRSINYDVMTPQPGDSEFLHFSFKTPYNTKYQNQALCHLTYTNPATHQIILDNLDQSPMFQKVIEGVGPRYCPSIEDKVIRFSEKDAHQIFIEPEGLDTNEIYAQGLNTSLPEHAQEAFLKTIVGLEAVKIIKLGYAVEYDFIYPDQLLPSLESRAIKNLFFAGQINGTSGYEEAAGQGIIAGINAGLSVLGKAPLILKRENSYIGTMIDDLITKNIYEPYRMLTSRSEYRLILRQDNAIFRLSEIAHDIGMLTQAEISQIRDIKNRTEAFTESWKKTKTNEDLMNTFSLKEKTTIHTLLKRPEVQIQDLVAAGMIADEDREIANRAMVEIKYEGYLTKQKRDIDKITQLEMRQLPNSIPYDSIQGLRTESREKFARFKPQTLYEAKKIAGINPADIMVVLGYIERHQVTR